MFRGGNYTFTGLYAGFQPVAVLNSAQGVLNAAVNNPVTLMGVVPNDGILVVGVVNNDWAGRNYDLSLNVVTPEPSTFAGAGLALASGLALLSGSAP